MIFVPSSLPIASCFPTRTMPVSPQDCFITRKSSKKKRKSSSRLVVVAVSQSQLERSKSTVDREKLKEREARERKEEVNRKVASKKAISIILRKEAAKAVIEKKRGGTNSRKLLPHTILEALHERITALRWESALKVMPSCSMFSLCFTTFLIVIPILCLMVVSINFCHSFLNPRL